GPLAAMLVSQGLRVVRRAGDALPSRAADLQGYDAVVLDDVPATVLSPAQMAALRDYVGTLGGGLVAIGGPQSFGIGGYAHTPLEQVLPVSMDVRHRLAIPSMAILLVIDASGSMGSFGNELAKVELAKETALAVVDLLGERDLIGVIAFDQEHRWLVPPIQARERQRILDQVSRLKAGGGTNMYPALEAAHTYLRRAAAKIKHVIALSDGQTDPGDFQRLVTAMARDQITVTSVAIGTDADVQLMRSISRWGQGRYYHAKDPYTVPQIFTAEALLASRAYLIEEPFIPRAAGDIPMLPGMRSLPQLRGYVATAPKAAADVHLVSHHDDPVLASWHYGLGRAVAFTSDARPRWAADWVRWRDGARAWSQMVRWAMRDAGGNLHLLSDVEGATGRLVLDARTPAGDLITDLDASARLVSPSGQAARVTLEQVAPGRYEAVIPLAETGAYAATVEARRDGRVVGARSAGLVASYSPEFRERGVNRPLLAHLVEVTGGRILSEPRQAAAPAPAGTRDHRDAWPWFAASAAALLVAEVAVRRVPALTQFVAEAAATVAGRLRGQPPAPAEAAEDHLYEEADRWRLGETEQASGIQVASMEHAARLYIARLKAMDESRRDPSDRSRSS
ncbi:MAG: VWA domain-containing protein, partial [Armatimonadetes bacterium]|nr:VWA domain-containing protein [Armatimonadota bacterium]